MILTDNKKISTRFPHIQYVREDELVAFYEKAKIQSIVCSRGFVKVALKAGLSNLRFIQLLSAGYEGVDLEECTKRDIVVSNAANVYSVGMAEFVVLCILRSAKRYNASINNSHVRLLRNYKFITELAGKSVVVLGVGGIGSEVAKRLQAFDMSVYGFARKTKEKPCFDVIVHSKEELKELLKQSDYVVSTLPDNIDTTAFVNRELLECMKDHVTIVNVGRRKVFNEDDLFSFLKMHKQATAFLDMFERLPNPITNRFRRLRNVCVLPGVTAISQEIDTRLYKLVENNLNRMANNELPINILNYA